MTNDNLKNLISPTPFVLASLLTSYPNAEFSESVGLLLQDSDLDLPINLKNYLQDLIQDTEKLDLIRAEYISVFDQSKIQNPVYETEYGRERAMFKANELADIAGFYNAFGFEIDANSTNRDMVDHVAVESEFYSILLMKLFPLTEMNDQNGCEIVLDAMKKFMQDHLGRFVTTIKERPGVQDSEFYKMVYDWYSDVVTNECNRLKVVPEKLQWLISQVEPEEVACGAAAAFNKNGTKDIQS